MIVSSSYCALLTINRIVLGATEHIVPIAYDITDSHQHSPGKPGKEASDLGSQLTIFRLSIKPQFETETIACFSLSNNNFWSGIVSL